MSTSIERPDTGRLSQGAIEYISAPEEFHQPQIASPSGLKDFQEGSVDQRSVATEFHFSDSFQH